MTGPAPAVSPARPPESPPELDRDAALGSGDAAAAARAITRKAARREQAAGRLAGRGVWFGFGMFGLVGWSVAVPLLAGVAAGLWLDRHWPHPGLSWTLALLLAGAALGCLNAWLWITREARDDD